MIFSFPCSRFHKRSRFLDCVDLDSFDNRQIVINLITKKLSAISAAETRYMVSIEDDELLDEKYMAAEERALCCDEAVESLKDNFDVS